MDFNTNYDTLAGDLEKFLRIGDEMKTREIALQLMENNIYFEIEVEEKINKPQPPLNSKVDPKANNKIYAAIQPNSFAMPSMVANNNENFKNKCIKLSSSMKNELFHLISDRATRRNQNCNQIRQRNSKKQSNL